MVFLLEHVMLLLDWPVFKYDLFPSMFWDPTGHQKEKKIQVDGT